MTHRDIIAIGGSLGSIDAAERVLSGLPKDLPVAVFIALHVGSVRFGGGGPPTPDRLVHRLPITPRRSKLAVGHVWTARLVKD
jgi:hypothetical protein